MRISIRPFSGWLYTSTCSPFDAKMDYAYRNGETFVVRYKDGTEKRI